MADVRFLTDEDLNSAILDGLRFRLPELDIVRVQDVGLRTFRDPRILQFAVDNGRILITHDVSTMRGFAIQRIISGKPMPGLIEIGQNYPIGSAIEELVLIAECTLPEDWLDQIRRLPAW